MPGGSMTISKVLHKIAAASLLLVNLLSCSYIDKAVISPAFDDGTVVLRYYSSSARTVQVAGDWNNWGAGDAGQGEVLVGLMEKDKRGIWTVRVDLPPGRYRYYFLLDEIERVIDPENPRVTDDPWGGKASLLIVP
jgi:1,4-alpha-glucan branching enzyme